MFASLFLFCSSPHELAHKHAQKLCEFLVYLLMHSNLSISGNKSHSEDVVKGVAT